MIRDAVQNDIHGNNSAFKHFFIRLTGSQALHLHTRPAENTGGFTAGMSESHEDFIADPGDNGKHGQMEQEAKKEIADRNQHIQYKEQEDTD